MVKKATPEKEIDFSDDTIEAIARALFPKLLQDIAKKNQEKMGMEPETKNP